MVSFFLIHGEIIKSNGEVFFNENMRFTIPEFKGIQKINSLPGSFLEIWLKAYSETTG